MKRKILIIMALSALILVMVVMSSYAADSTVCPAGLPTCDFATIQAAIDDAGTVNGDTITVYAGTYTLIGTLNVNKEITIIGDDRDNVIIDASGFSGTAISIPSNNVMLSTFTLIGTQVSGTSWAIKPSGGVTGIIVEDVTILNSGRTGIDLNNNDNTIIRNVEVRDSDLYGIFLRNCDNVLLEDLTTSGNYGGGITILADSEDVSGIVFSGIIDSSETCILMGENIECGFYTQATGGWTISGDFYPQYSYKLLLPNSAAGFELYLKDFATASEYAFLAYDAPGPAPLPEPTPQIIDLSTGTDAVPGSLSLLINGGAGLTNNPVLSLGLSSTNVNEMRFSCDNVQWTAWERMYTPSRSFDLGSNPGCDETLGIKTVYFDGRNFFNLGAPLAAIASDSIYLEGDTEAEGGIDINVSDDDDSGCYDPIVYMDHTARLWQPNDQTIYTARVYGTNVSSRHPGYYGDLIEGYEVPLRQNYVFAGETLNYFIIVEDENGADDIGDVMLVLNITDPVSMMPQEGIGVGRCAEVDDFNLTDAFISEEGDTIGAYDPDTMQSYVCTLIVQSKASWNTAMDVGFRVSDTGEGCVGDVPNLINVSQSDWINFNPDLGVSLSGPITFGSVAPGTTALSNTIYIRNNGEDDSGVIMDMYIASSDYFTDPSNPIAICGSGNGIRYDLFGYYATKGSMNSGANDNVYSMLGESAVGTCEADPDEFTPLPSHSGEISDMCRIINHNEQGSLLAEGAEMSMTFKLDVPSNCIGHFTNGQFYIIGRVI